MVKVYLVSILKQFKIILGRCQMLMNNFIRILKQKKTIIFLSIFASLGVGIFLVFRFFTPFGAIVSYQFNSMFDRDKLSKIQGAQESSSFNPTQNGVLQIPQQTIRQNVVTFNLKLITKPIEGVWVNLRFKGNPKEVKIGVRGSEKEKYQYLPLYNQMLNSLFWNQTTSGGTTFWQRAKKYNDISELVSKPPISDDVKTASYFFDPTDLDKFQAKTASLASAEKNTVFNIALRGSHTFFILANKKPLTISVTKQDANAYKGEDVLSIELYKGDKQIIKKEIPDDGISDISNLKMTPQTEQMKIDNIEPGIYRLVLTDQSIGMDVQIGKIETNQSSLVSGSLFIVDEKLTTLWTNSKKVTLRTPHTVGIQTVKLDGKYDLKVEKENQNFVFDLNKPESKTASASDTNTRVVHKLEIPKNDLGISGDGYFSLSQESLFNPNPVKTIDLSTVTDIDKIDYIIANYQPAKKDGEWYTVQAYFDPKDVVIDGDKLYFSLESPGLSGYGGEIVIDSLEVTVKKPGWFSGTIGQKAGETTNVSQNNEGKPTIFTKFTVGVKYVWQKIKGFFIGIFKKPVAKNETATPSPSPTSISIKTIAPTTSLKPSPTPTATSSAATITLLVRVLNGGSEKGSAASVSAMLKNNGFANVKADNADNQDYKGVTINYRKDDLKIAEKIESLLKKDYGTITKTQVATSTAEIVTILGKK